MFVLVRSGILCRERKRSLAKIGPKVREDPVHRWRG